MELFCSCSFSYIFFFWEPHAIGVSCQYFEKYIHTHTHLFVFVSFLQLSSMRCRPVCPTTTAPTYYPIFSLHHKVLKLKGGIRNVSMQRKIKWLKQVNRLPTSHPTFIPFQEPFCLDPDHPVFLWQEASQSSLQSNMDHIIERHKDNLRLREIKI